MRPDTEFSADADVSGKIGLDGLEGEAKAYARESMDRERRGRMGPAEGRMTGRISAEAEASAKGRLTPDRAEVSGSFFAGAKSRVTFRGTVYGLGAEVTIGPRFGIGGDGSAFAGKDENGEYGVGARGGLALGPGLELGFKGVFDSSVYGDPDGDGIPSHSDGMPNENDVDPASTDRGDGPEAELDAVDPDRDGIASHRDATPNQNDTDPTSTDRGDGPEAEAEAANRSRDSHTVGPADNPENGGDRDSSSYGSGTDTSSSRSGPADNPGNGGDRDSSSYGRDDSGGDDSGRSGPADGTSPSGGGHAVE